MKVLHISTFGGGGGAATGMLRWHRHLVSHGVESRVLCLENPTNDRTSSLPSRPRDPTQSAKAWALQRRWIDRNRTAFSDNFFSQAFFDYQISEESLVGWADVIHLHWVSRFLDLGDLVNLCLRHKPIVATPHDLWSLTGGCHYPSVCRQYHVLCKECPMVDPESHEFIEMNHRFKREVFSELVQTWICPSNWIKDEILRCQGLSSKNFSVVPYVCDLESFWPGEKVEDRVRLGLPADHRLILFVAENLGEERKGFGDFEQVLLRLQDLIADKPGMTPIAVVLVGRPREFEKEKFKVPVFELGHIKEIANLRAAYSAADIFLYTGKEDNLPNVVNEALASGTPVIGYRTGGIVDQVESGLNGLLVDPGSVDELAEVLSRIIFNQDQLTALSRAARTYVETRFNDEQVLKDLIKVYELALSERAEPSTIPKLDHYVRDYETLAVKALASLLADADQRIPELSGEAAWLQAHFIEADKQRATLAAEVESLKSRLSDADQELESLRGYKQAVEPELQSLRGYKQAVEPELQFLREYRRQVDKLLNPFRKVPGFKWLLQIVINLLRR